MPGTTQPATGRPVADPPPRRPRAERVLLRSGTPAEVVALGPGDLDEVLALHRRLGERDTYLRFATLHPAGLERFLRHTLAADSGDSTLGARVRGRLVGVVQLLPCGDGEAEVAAVVDADERHEGVATVLLEHLAAVARRLGVERLVAEVLAENGPMLRVLKDLGMPVETTREGSGLRLVVALHPGQAYRDAAESRYRTAAAASLRPVLRPRSIAVVGVGRGEGSIGRAVLRSLRAGGFPGPVHAVHPAADAEGGLEVEGHRCLPSIGAAPAPVDLAVVCAPAAAVPGVVAECGEAGVGGVLVLSGGLAAVPGARERLDELGNRYGMRLIGPNSLGVAAPGPATALVASFAGPVPPAGDIGLVAQSGGIAIAVLSSLQQLGLGLSAGVAVGDAYDVGTRDLLAWYDEDPATGLVVSYAESEPDLRGLVGTAQHLARRLPVLAVAAGDSAAGARAATSHTARAATPAVVREAVARAAGVQTVPDTTTLAAAAALLRGQPLPRAGTVAVLSNAGGVGVLLADACVAAGLPVQPLPADLQDSLRAILPPLASTANPVDTGAAVSADSYAAALRRLREHPAVAAVVTATLPTGVGDPGPGVVAGAAGEGAPVVDVRLGRSTVAERLELDGGRFLVSLADPAVAARALSVAVARRNWLHRPHEDPANPPGVDVHGARDAVAAVLARAPDGDWMEPDEAGRLCAAAGLPVAVTAFVRTPEEAAAAASSAGGPVVVKGVVRGVVHKSDAGLLRLPVAEPAEVAAIVAAWARAAGPDWRGAVVQPLVPPGDELLVGAVRDPSAGAVVAVGPGGRAADALGNRVHRLAPLSDVDAHEALTATGLFATPHGAGLHRAAVVDCLRRVGWLADALPQLAEVEVNPLRVDAGGCLALDVRARVAPRSG